jgi:hypothetical protein
MRPCKLEFLFLCALIGMLMNMIDLAKAQGIERLSLSGESVAEQLRRTGNDQPYNMHLGPVSVRTEADVTANFNDNIGLTKNGRTADCIVTPEAYLYGTWKVSDLNTIQFDIGLGYEAYLLHSQFNNIIVSPDSIAQFNLFVGDVLITFHDAFSYQQDPTQIGQLSNQTRLARFTNDAGVTATWDLNDIVLTLAYDHSNLWVTQSAYSYLTNQSDTVAPKFTVKVNETIDTGVEVSVTDVRYDQSFQNDYVSESAGPFVTARLSSNLSVEGRIGGYFSQYSSGGGNGDSQSNVSSFYGSVAVNHRINDTMNESATAGREYIPGLTSNYTQRIYANYTYTWQAMKYLNLGGNILWENLNDSDATAREDSNRYGAGVSVNDSIAEHATLTFNYQYLIKDANPTFLSYYQNSTTVALRYQF